jgi:hypothetical protein
MMKVGIRDTYFRIDEEKTFKVQVEAMGRCGAPDFR